MTECLVMHVVRKVLIRLALQHSPEVILKCPSLITIDIAKSYGRQDLWDDECEGMSRMLEALGFGQQKGFSESHK
ncbi:hypothetical protein KIN20_028092 [Parelaphostrongylus tenuis]|uniref:Uncharacterized protein n=1 Tax=Parelaphostrongylus tenuis TaxID=148309 RepID=A0AAD5R089_PARTN|nr:hypothetical protein KIN20_028092 [Parelaphostrongylus tenuis]